MLLLHSHVAGDPIKSVVCVPRILEALLSQTTANRTTETGMLFDSLLQISTAPATIKQGLVFARKKLMLREITGCTIRILRVDYVISKGGAQLARGFDRYR